MRHRGLRRLFDLARGDMIYVIAIEFLFLIADGIIAARVRRLLNQRKAGVVGKVHDLARREVDHPHTPENE